MATATQASGTLVFEDQAGKVYRYVAEAETGPKCEGRDFPSPHDPALDG